jgi:hypothetical protein
MKLSEVQEELKDDPETIFVKFGGQERPFLISALGMERARQRQDPVPVILDLIQRYGELTAAFTGDGELDMEEVRSVSEEVVKGSDLFDLTLVVWSGFLTFDEDISLEAVQALTSPGRVTDIGRDVAASITSFLRDHADQEAKEGPDAGGDMGN